MIMNCRSLVVLALCLFVCNVLGDCYLQGPRGSNNRLNEEGDRQNAQRLFDSQNNARGGYCWGPPLSYVEGSILPLEWTSQHGCGGPHVTCTEIIQYMCSDTNGPVTSLIRDGTTIERIPEDENGATAKNADGTLTFGMMENYQYYKDCKGRERNKGLFIADQKVGPDATRTRQNPGGTRYAYECAEERDYYPYWHPSPWKDIAVLVPNLEHCKYYQAESQNVKPKSYCKGATLGNNALNPNYEQACNAAQGQWVSEPAWGIPPPECKLAHFSRDNHLGNVEGGAETANYTWILPNEEVESCVKTGTCNCAVRIRYNITTNESTGLTGEFLDVRRNKELRNDPTVPLEDWEYTLAINTAQFGRTFQDRSFVFNIAPRPKGVSKNTKIYNLNVRGKRGNIVQTFPATEYDFSPNRLHVEEGDIVHFQWTGCDNNPQNNDGEGLKRTDRSNIVQIKDLDSNIPMVFTNDTNEKRLFESAYLRNRMALIGQTGCKRVSEINGDADQDLSNCAILNAAKTPYFDGGLVRMNQTGKFTYMSTRNNNFSNRTQKGQLVVDPKKKLSSGAAVGIAITVIVVVAAAAIGGLVFYGKRNPNTSVGRAVDKVKLPSFSSSSSSSSTGASVKERKAALLADHN